MVRKNSDYLYKVTFSLTSELHTEVHRPEVTCFPRSVSISQVNRASSTSACVLLSGPQLAYKSIFKIPSTLPSSTALLLRIFCALWVHLVTDPGFETHSCELVGKWCGDSCHALRKFKESLFEQVVIHHSFTDKNTNFYLLSPFRPHGFWSAIYIFYLYVYI